MKMASGTVVALIALVLVVITRGEETFDPSSLTPSQCAERFAIEKVIPFDAILMDVLAAYRYDHEVKAAFDHLVSEEFKAKFENLAKTREYQAVKKFFESSNLKIMAVINVIKALVPTLALKAENAQFQDVNPEEITGGVNGLLMRIFKQRICLMEVRKTVVGLMACNPQFKDTMTTLHSSEFKDAFRVLRTTPAFKEVVEDLEEFKIYVNVYLDVLLDFFDIQL